MKEIPRKTYTYGRTKVTIVSPLVAMTREEQHEWFESEWKKGNPVLKDIVDAATACLENHNEK